MKRLTQTDKIRYSRQIMLDGFGESAQERLKNSTVLVIGAGGLGSPAILYLASAGVGKIVVADYDEVDLSNLQRQIIHNQSRIGSIKSLSAKMSVEALNPDVKVVAVTKRVDEKAALDLIGSSDFVLDCSDNFATKFLINKLCVEQNKPFNHAAIMYYGGQTMSVVDGSACLACLFQQPQDSDKKNGIFCTVPAILGTIQANEAIKYLSGVGELLTNQIQYFNAKKGEFRTIKLSKNQSCKVCGNG